MKHDVMSSGIEKFVIFFFAVEKRPLFYAYFILSFVRETVLFILSFGGQKKVSKENPCIVRFARDCRSLRASSFRQLVEMKYASTVA